MSRRVAQAEDRMTRRLGCMAGGGVRDSVEFAAGAGRATVQRECAGPAMSSSTASCTCGAALLILVPYYYQVVDSIKWALLHPGSERSR